MDKLNYEKIKQLLKQGQFEVRLLLKAGLFTRTLIGNRYVFHYIDESDRTFKTEKEFKKYINQLCARGWLIFDGYC